MNALIDFLKKNPVRIKAALVSVLALFSDFISPDLQGKIVSLVMLAVSILGGEIAQRVENKKTNDARLSDIPVESAGISHVSDAPIA
ncbi:hypothetical protein MOV08_05305 [Streptomyces yunnanensis]|uniref:Holin n=1 Tax=Streptomyces yunnanensis TaxID=156453 RepID=A0ABY8A1W7_9ACTN|nr:hypothetical protein [Streptomyces yunnanensis]WEB38778.1 hypothetical protein MOV08_05305 [Streptomyces yunnanensis]